MDAIQELEIRQGELKEELAGLLDSDAENERVGVLTRELRALERQITARRVLGRLSLKPGAWKVSRRIGSAWTWKSGPTWATCSGW